MSDIIPWGKLDPIQRDTAISDLVMHWEPKECQGEMWELGTYWKCSNCSLTGDWTYASSDTFIGHVAQCPCYTSDISAAWLVVEHFTVPDVSSMTITHIPAAQHWTCELQFASGWRSEAYGTTAMEAICIAALHSQGVQVER